MDKDALWELKRKRKGGLAPSGNKDASWNRFQSWPGGGDQVTFGGGIRAVRQCSSHLINADDHDEIQRPVANFKHKEPL